MERTCWSCSHKSESSCWLYTCITIPLIRIVCMGSRIWQLFVGPKTHFSPTFVPSTSGFATAHHLNYHHHLQYSSSYLLAVNAVAVNAASYLWKRKQIGLNFCMHVAPVSITIQVDTPNNSVSSLLLSSSVMYRFEWTCFSVASGSRIEISPSPSYSSSPVGDEQGISLSPCIWLEGVGRETESERVQMGNGTSIKLVNFEVSSLSVLWHRKIRLLMRHTDPNSSIEVADTCSSDRTAWSCWSSST